MEDKTKLYVFAKKEILLIFLFMILIGLISFTLGFQMGKKYEYKHEGFLKEDQEKVEMYSKQEESVQETVQEYKKTDDKKSEEEKNAMLDSTYKKLKEEFNRLDEHADSVKPQDESLEKVLKEEASKLDTKHSPAASKVAKAPSAKRKRDELSGKYTIQLGSYQSKEEATNFADGFKVRGYNPIISEVYIKERGIWFRVSLGIFDSSAESKEYILKEKSLFRGSNYVIKQFD